MGIHCEKPPETEFAMTIACIAFGGNLGNVADNFHAVPQQLGERGVRVLATSSLYETTPVGASAGGTYRNGAFVVDTSHSSLGLLHELQAIEQNLGRVRTGHWGARTVDLDLILFGDEVRASAELTLPHPACWFRRFVLDPLCEIAPEAQHPVAHRTLADLREVLLPRPLTGEIRGVTTEEYDRIAKPLQERFGDSVKFVCPDDPPATMLFQIQFHSPNSPPFNPPPEVEQKGTALTFPVVLVRDDPDAWDRLVADLSHVLTAALDEPRRIEPLSHG